MYNNNDKFNANAAVITLGCRLNQAESAIIFKKLDDVGFRIVKYDSKENICIIIINTCSVTSLASKKSKKLIRSVKKLHEESYIVVTGCDPLVNREKQYTEIADIIIPNFNKTNIEKLLYFIWINKAYKKEKKKIFNFFNNKFIIKNKLSFFKEKTIGHYPFKTRANLKIQDGCDAFCTYCSIPYGRGMPKYREWNDIIVEFKKLLEIGYKEIVLTGINIAIYNYKNRLLIDLIKRLCDINGNFRIRLSSIEFNEQLEELIYLMKSTNKICNFLHISIQSGNNEILKLMGRNYYREEYKNFILMSKNEISNLCIGSDIIVGFPYETEAKFVDSLEFINNLPLSYLNVFRFSKRIGTPASLYTEQIQDLIIKKRYLKLLDISKILSNNFMSKQRNKIVTILYESCKNGIAVGLSDNYIRVHTEINDNVFFKYVIGNLVNTKLLKILDYRNMIGYINI